MALRTWAVAVTMTWLSAIPSSPSRVAIFTFQHTSPMQPELEPLVPHELYGGAITVSFPARFADVSDFRPVPDHQEVWADATEDQSLVVEIVEHDPRIPDEYAPEHYWQDLATNNESSSSQLSCIQELGGEDVPLVTPGRLKTAIIVMGTQVVSKGRQSQDKANQVSIHLAILRMPQVGSDILITLNTPVVINPTSQAAESAGAGLKTKHWSAQLLMGQILKSFRIVDWSLFGH